VLEQLEEYATGINASQEVCEWLKTVGKKALYKKQATVGETEHVLDFLNSDAAPVRLRRMSFQDAKRKSVEWSERNQKKGRDLIDSSEDLELIHDFLDGKKIVRLKTKKAFQREGFLMNHCVGGYDNASQDCLIYSYRDSQNMPHATFEIRKEDNEIVQIKGKGNGPIHPKYIHPILSFLKSVGMDIRPSDMSNLGYHHIHKSHIEFLKTIEAAWKQVTMINGEAYAH